MVRKVRSLGGKVIAVDRNTPVEEVDDFLQVDLMDKQAVERAATDLSRRGANDLRTSLVWRRPIPRRRW